MPTSRKQVPTTIDRPHYQRYKALSNVLGGQKMAEMHRAAHHLYLDTFAIRSRVLAKYRQKGIYLSEVELVRKLLYAEFYRDELTIVKQD